MHTANPHHSGYDMPALVQALPELKSFIIQNKHGHDSIDFSNPLAVKLLNRALLKTHYNVAYWDIPDGFLCPPIPGRCDYICHLQEFLTGQGIADEPIQALDIGTGANLVYPIIGSQLLNWKFKASDIEPISVAWARELIKQNAHLKKSIKVVQQSNPKHIFKGVIQETDYFHITLCNPPFHANEAQAQQGSIRKNKNLNRNKSKRGSNVNAIKQADSLNFAGQHNELWCEGGELAFIQNMIKESALFKQQVAYFSCLVSKKENLTPLKKQLNALKQAGLKGHEVVNMSQGSKISRLLIWWF